MSGRLAYFDCPSGAAGDMVMAALVDAGASFEALQGELAKLGVSGWALTRREVKKGDFRALKIDVEIDDRAHHPHRRLADVLAILERSGLDGDLQAPASRIFTRLADGEAPGAGTSREDGSLAAV